MHHQIKGETDMMVWIVIRYQKYLETVRSDRIAGVFDSHAKALNFIEELKGRPQNDGWDFYVSARQVH